jgi:hypothetical protein
MQGGKKQMSALLIEEIFSYGIKLIGIVCGFMLVFQVMNFMQMRALRRYIKAVDNRLSSLSGEGTET